MAARLSRLIALATLLGSPLASAAAQRQVLTADAIRRAGVVRLGDVVALADRWDVTTIDGITWQAAPNGLAPLGGGRWIVLVDGQQVDLGLFGTLNLNRLPVPLQRIDSVEVIDAPYLAAGELTPGGVLHIHTRRPSRGVSAEAWVTTGSEIGDPGPFAFTPRASPNVDRLGHEYAASAGYRAEGWWADASFTVLEHPPTDPALLRRYGAASGGDRLRIDGSAPAVRIGAQLFGGSHEFVHRYSRLANFFSPTPPAGPFATVERWSHLGLSGTVRFLRYYATREVNQSSAVARLTAWTAGVEMFRARGRMIGARFRDRGADSAASVSMYGAAGPLLAAVSLEDDELDLAVAATKSWVVGRRSDVRASASYIGRTGTIAADVIAGMRLAGSTRLEAGAQWRSLDDVALAQRELHYIPGTESFEEASSVAVGATGQVAGIEIGLLMSPQQHVRVDARYRLRGAVAGGAEFRNAWTVVPRHAGRGTFTYSPVEGFDLQLIASFRGRTQWADYRVIEAESGGRYRAALPTSLAFDATVQKWLWNGRLRGLLGIRNVTGTPLRYHPTGATWSPAFVLQAEARL